MNFPLVKYVRVKGSYICIGDSTFYYKKFFLSKINWIFSVLPQFSPVNDISKMSPLSFTEFVQELKRARTYKRTFPITFVVVCIIFAFISFLGLKFTSIIVQSSSNPPLPIVVSFFISIFIMLFCAFVLPNIVKTDEEKGGFILEFSFDQKALINFRELQTVFNIFNFNGGLKWSLISDNNYPPKTNGFQCPPGIKSNILIPCLAGIKSLYFLPDQILCYDPNDISIISYEEIFVTPGTSTIKVKQRVSGGWKHSTKDGKKDRRFKHNYQVYRNAYVDVTYGTLSFSAPNGNQMSYQFQDPNVAFLLANAILKYKQDLILQRPIAMMPNQPFHSTPVASSTTKIANSNDVNNNLPWLANNE